MHLILKCTRRITPQHVTIGKTDHRGSAPGQHCSEETSQRWRTVGDTASDLTDPVFKPHTSRTDRNVLSTELIAFIGRNKQAAIRLKN